MPVRFYYELARWWPLISPVADYAEEAGEFVAVLRDAVPRARSVLELGSGGGHNAHYMKRQFALTLSDASEPMLDLSRRLNPDCEHLAGDMRTVDIGRQFDAVFVHDAIDYMTTEADLSAAVANAARHCRPGGAVLLVPDHTAESFAPSTGCGGTDGENGEAVRYLEWTWDPDPSDTRGAVLYSFLIRERDGTWWPHAERHEFGLFSTRTWQQLMAAAGLTPEVVIEHTAEERPPRTFFLGRRHA